MNSNLLGYELSPVQKRVWRQQEQALHHDHQVVLLINRPPDEDRIRECLTRLVQRHEILQLKFVAVDGVKYPVQAHGEGPFFSLRMLAYNSPAPASPAAAPLTADVLPLQEDLFRIYFTASPLYVDLYSLQLIARDFSRCYMTDITEDAIWDQEKISYTQFAGWLAGLQDTPEEEALLFWNRNLSLAVRTRLTLEKESLPGQHQMLRCRRLVLPATTANECKAAAAAGNTMPEKLLFSVFAWLLTRYDKGNTCCINCTFQDRLTELETTVGPVAITVPVGIELHVEDTWQTYLSKVARDWDNAREQQEYFTTGNNQDWLSLPGFEYLSFPDEVLPKGVEWYREQYTGCSGAYPPIKLVVINYSDRMVLDFYYDPVVYDEDSIEWISRICHDFLVSLPAPDQSPEKWFEGDAGFHRQLPEQDTQPWPETTIVAWFRKNLDLHRHNCALVYNERNWTYEQVDKASDKLADLLAVKYGLGPGKRAGVLLERSDELIITLLAILKTGAGYVPIDTGYPVKRITGIIGDAALSLLVTRAAGIMAGYPDAPALYVPHDIQDLPDMPQDSKRLTATVSPEDTAYIIYTSGTTGRPKGVEVSHGSICNTLQWRCTYYQFNEKDIVLQIPSIAFDSSVEDVWCALLCGSRLVMQDENKRHDPSYLKALLAKYAVSNLLVVPSFYKFLLEELYHDLSHLRIVSVAGEALLPGVRQLHFERFPHTRLVNEYGPTENAVCSTAAEICNDKQTITIGKPIPGVKCYIVDDSGKLLPPGFPGELYLSGKGLAKGYWGLPDLTAAKFIEKGPVTGERMYRTGDLGYWLPNGNIVFLGRVDLQVKIRGYRVEPSEVAAVMEGMNGVRSAAVIASRDPENDTVELVAYYTGDAIPEEDRFYEYLRSYLPDFMIPRHYIQLDKIPLTPNGKLDVAGLPDPAALREHQPEKQLILPADEREQMLLDIWVSVLNRTDISVTDNFYTIGGDSIKAIQVAARMHAAGYRLEVRDIFRSPDIRSLAGLLADRLIVVQQEVVTGKVALLPVQQYFFAIIKTAPGHYNQSVLLTFRTRLDNSVHQAVFDKLYEQHDMLRVTYQIGETDVVQYCGEPRQLPIALHIAGGDHKELQEEMTAVANDLHTGISLENGPLIKVAQFRYPDADRLLIVVHHLIMDGVSWRILLADLHSLYLQAMQQQVLQLPPRTQSYQWFANRIMEYGRDIRPDHMLYWQERQEEVAEHNHWCSVSPGFVTERKELSFSLSSEAMAFWTQLATRPGFSAEHLLLTILATGLQKTYDRKCFPVMMEYHGRDIIDDASVSHTLGWFTVLYPLLLESGATLTDTITMIRKRMQAVPDKGAGAGLLITPQHARPAILFNYLGEWNTVAATIDSVFEVTGHAIGQQQNTGQPLEYAIEFSGMIVDGVLTITVGYDHSRIKDADARALYACCTQQLQAKSLEETVRELGDIAHAFTGNGITIDEINALFE